MDKIMTKRIWRFEGLSTPRLASGVQQQRKPSRRCRHWALPHDRQALARGLDHWLTKVTGIRPSNAPRRIALASQYDPEVLCEAVHRGR
jgi:D-alanine-D-alanine ligase